MDVLIACPTADRLFDQTVRSIFGQVAVAARRVDVLFPWQGDGDITDARDRIAAKYNAARRAMLDGGYDALLTIESDMIVPHDALAKLLAADADVVYGLYCLRRPPYEWNAYSVIADMRAWVLSKVPDRARADWGKVVPVDGIGLGCTLIRRRVLEQIAFRADGALHDDGRRSHCDWYFALDCLGAGFVSCCDTRVVCGHITPVDETGAIGPSVIWPDMTSETLYRFEEFGNDQEATAD